MTYPLGPDGLRELDQQMARRDSRSKTKKLEAALVEWVRKVRRRIVNTLYGWRDGKSKKNQNVIEFKRLTKIYRREASE
jgi:hypothetical protein